MSRYDLTEKEWQAIQPHLPNKPRGVPRVDDRRVLNCIFWVLRSGAFWSDLPERYGPPTTIYNRFNRWRKAGVWDRLMDEITKLYDGDVQMIDTSVVRVHQQGATAKMYGPPRRCKGFGLLSGAVCVNVSGLSRVDCCCSQAMMRCARIVPNKSYGHESPFFDRAYDAPIDCSDIIPPPRN
jgi:transposase